MSAKEEADKLRSEAKKLFLDLFHLRKPDIERIVDCIIGAAVLEVAAIQQAAQQSVQADDATVRAFEKAHDHSYGYNSLCGLCNPHRN